MAAAYVPPKYDDGSKLMGKCLQANQRVASGISNTVLSTQLGVINPPGDGSGPCGTAQLCNIFPPDGSTLDRNGHPIYTTFNMSGDQDLFCRSTPLHGHPQDFSRTLYNSDVAGVTKAEVQQMYKITFPNGYCWEERGVELYENFGLDTTVRTGGGSYGAEGSNKATIDGQNTYACPANSGYPTCRNECITELGRKVTLFGQTAFAYYSSNVVANMKNWFNLPKWLIDNPTGIITYPTAVPTMFDDSQVSIVLNFFAPRPSFPVPSQQYNYFGNSGAIIRDALGNQWFFIFGMPLLVSYMTKNGPGVLQKVPQSSLYHADVNTGFNVPNIIYDATNRSMVITAWYFSGGIIPSITGLTVTGIQTPNTFNGAQPGVSYLSDMVNLASAYPVPGNTYLGVTTSYATNDPSWWSAPVSGNNNIVGNKVDSGYVNCYYTGFRSMYIPPHMEVTCFVNATYSPTSGTYGTTINADMTPVTYDMSPYSNGTFPSLGSNDPNGPMPQNTPYHNTTNECYNCVSAPGITPQKAGYFSPSPGNCALHAVWVDVRRDSEFFSRYVTSTITSQFIPEIFLIPGIATAQDFPQYFKDAGGDVSKLPQFQRIPSPQNYWIPLDGSTGSGNPYCKKAGLVVIDPSKTPYNALPVAAQTAAVSGTMDLMMKPVHSLTKKLTGQRSKLMDKLKNGAVTLVSFPQKLSQINFENMPMQQDGAISRGVVPRQDGAMILATGTVSGDGTWSGTVPTNVPWGAKPYVGTGRIKSFMPMNWVMSLEWLYVLYRCVYNYIPNGNNAIAFNKTTGQYTCASGGCGQECMLFRDPYYNYYGGGDTSSISASDTFMNTYCSIKNYSLAYLPYVNVLTNDCSCTSAPGMCPVKYNASCNVTGTSNKAYISDQGINVANSGTCDECGYCQMINVQIDINNKNNLQVQNPTQTCPSTCTTTNPPPPPPPVTTATKKWEKWIPYLIVIVLILVFAIIFGVFGYKAYSRHAAQHP